MCTDDLLKSDINHTLQDRFRRCLGQRRVKLYTLVRAARPKIILYPAPRPPIGRVREYPPGVVKIDYKTAQNTPSRQKGLRGTLYLVDSGLFRVFWSRMLGIHSVYSGSGIATQSNEPLELFHFFFF